MNVDADYVRGVGFTPLFICFSRLFAIALQSMAIVIMCRLFVMRVYCDKTAEARIMLFLSRIAQCVISSTTKWEADSVHPSLTARCGAWF